MSHPVLVLPHARPYGLDHDPSTGPHVGRDGEVVEICSFPVVTLARAFEPWETDAHAVQYLVPGETEAPRINQAALPWLQSLGKEPVMVRAVIDCDTPGHVPWSELPSADAWWSETLAVLSSAPDLEGAAWYHTRAGYRLWWELAAPVPVSRWHAFYTRFHEHLTGLGILADRLPDWTRLMRLPRVVRDGVAQDLPTCGHLPGVLRWSPGTPARLYPQTPAPRSVTATPREAPPYVPPTPEEWSMLRRRRVRAEVVEHLQAGRPLALPPRERPAGARGRDGVFLEYAGTIVSAFGALDPALLYRYTYASIQAQDDEPAEICLATLWDRCCYLVSKHGVQGARVKAAAPQPPPTLALVPRDEDTGSPDPLPPGDDGIDDVEGLVDQVAAGVADLAHAGAVARRLLLTEATARAYWVYDERRSTPTREVYQGPVASALVVPSMERYCPSLTGRLRSEGGNPYETKRILADSGWVISHAEYRAGVSDSTYNPRENRLTCAAASWRELEPREDPEIAAWLELVGGDHVESFLDWLATFRRVDQATCGLYLHAPKGLGKQLLAEGLGRLFASGVVVPYGVMDGEFKDDLFDSLLVWADETIPKDRKGATPSATFRELVGNQSRRINRKGLPALYLRGFPRLLITANNDSVFAIEHEDLTAEDLEAIIERIGYIRLGYEPGAYLERLGGIARTRVWVDQCLLARHVIWLEKHRKVEPGPRFLVAGWRTAMHDQLLQKAGLTQLVLTALAALLADLKTWGATGAAVVKDGGLYVNAAEFRKLWARLLPEAKPVHLHRLTGTLKTLSRPWAPPDGDLTRSIRVGTGTLNFWHVDASAVIRTAEALQIGDPEALRAALRGPLKISEKTG